MRAYEFLNESFDSNVPIEIVSQTRINFRTTANIGDRQIVFNADWLSVPTGSWELKFAEIVNKKYSVSDRVANLLAGDKDKTYQDISFDVTGSGSQMMVFSFVIESIKKFVSIYHPKLFFFEAIKEGNREKLYAKMASRIKIPGYELTDVGKEDNNTKYFVIKRIDSDNKQLDETDISLSQLYSDNYPDHDEIFWNYVSNSDLNTKFEVEKLSPMKLDILLMSQYRVEHIDEIVDMLKDEQIEIINDYRSSPNLSDSIIVVANNRIIDGNHRALAAALNNVSIKCIDLDQENDQEINENMDHSKDDQAVPQLKAALLAQKKKIQSVKDDKDAVYDIIDDMMTSISKAHSISGQKLHDMWTAKYKEIPDTWIMHQ
jgi:hypothetical protein